MRRRAGCRTWQSGPADAAVGADCGQDQTWGQLVLDIDVGGGGGAAVGDGDGVGDELAGGDGVRRGALGDGKVGMGDDGGVGAVAVVGGSGVEGPSGEGGAVLDAGAGGDVGGSGGGDGEGGLCAGGESSRWQVTTPPLWVQGASAAAKVVWAGRASVKVMNCAAEGPLLTAVRV